MVRLPEMPRADLYSWDVQEKKLVVGDVVLATLNVFISTRSHLAESGNIL